MKSRMLPLFLAALIMSTLLIVPAMAQVQNPLVGIPVTGTTQNANSKFSFTGTLDITGFAAQENQLVALGTLNGVLKNPAGRVVRTVTDLAVTLPLLNVVTEEVCQILKLDIGAIDLNLLGLRVQVAPIHILVTANPAQGILGDLLCAIANLFNGGVDLAGVATLLNQLLGLLGTV